MHDRQFNSAKQDIECKKSGTTEVQDYVKVVMVETERALHPVAVLHSVEIWPKSLHSAIPSEGTTLPRLVR